MRSRVGPRTGLDPGGVDADIHGLSYLKAVPLVDDMNHKAFSTPYVRHRFIIDPADVRWLTATLDETVGPVEYEPEGLDGNDRGAELEGSAGVFGQIKQ